MNTRSWLLLVLVFTLLTLLIPGCGGGTATEPQVIVVTATDEPEPEVIVVTATDEPEPRVIVVTATAAPQVIVVTATPEAGAEEEIEAAETEPETAETQADEPAVADTIQDAVEMFLSSQKAMTQYSPRPEPFIKPASLEEIAEPSENSWQTLNPGDDPTDFRSYDGVRIMEEGEAILDLGNEMILTLKRDAIATITDPELTEKTLNKLNIDYGDMPLLAQSGIALHLARGGFVGEKVFGDYAIPLTTPNGVALISGTEFSVTYDPDSGITTIFNFDGTVDVVDLEERKGNSLPDGVIEIIPEVRGFEQLPIAPELNPEEFLRLIDHLESPLLAADIVTGPYLVRQVSPEIDIYDGPGPEFQVVGILAEGDYARVIGQGRGWWQIECPQNLAARNIDCWVDGDLITEHNVEEVPETALPASPTPPPPTIPPPTIPPPTIPPPTVTPTVAVCTISPSGTFLSHWDKDSIGCPTGGASTIWMAEESFSGGKMLWREDTDLIYTVYYNGTWGSYDDIWHEGDPEYSCEGPPSPPTPIRGFGKIWCSYSGVRGGLGNATDHEWGASGVVQLFEEGFMLQSPGGGIYSFSYNGSWY